MVDARMALECYTTLREFAFSCDSEHSCGRNVEPVQRCIAEDCVKPTSRLHQLHGSEHH